MGVYGAADSTLVNMSYKAAMANVPLDQTAIFAQREENLKQFTSAVSKLFEPMWADHKATEKTMKDLAQQTEEILLEGGNTNDYSLDLHQNTVYGFKDELDAIARDRTLDARGKERARQKLEMKMNKYKNQMTESKVLFEEMVNYSSLGQVYHTPGSPEANTWNAILDDYNNGTNNATQSVENGEIFYSFEGNKMSLKDIKKGLSKHDPEFQASFQKKINEYVAQLKSFQQQGIDISPTQFNQMKVQLSKNVNTMDQVRNIANMEDPNTGMTFNQILYGQGKVSGVNGHEMINNEAIGLIHAELDKLSTKYGHGAAGNDGNSPIDMNNDGVYDATDMKMYHDPANAKLLIKKIEEDPDLYKELVINYTMETNVKNVYAQSMFEQAEAVRLEALKNQRTIKFDKEKKMNTAKANVYASQQPTATQIRRDKQFKADDKSIRKMIETLDFKKMAGKKNRVVDLGNGTYDIYIDNVKQNTEPIDIDKIGVENFGNFVYNAMMQKYENTRNTTFAQ